VLHTSYKSDSSFFLVLIFLFQPKSNDLLIFTVAPLAMMATSHLEMPQVKLKQNGFIRAIVACSFFFFHSYNLVPYAKSPASPVQG
jgi:hypothetical protein